MSLSVADRGDPSPAATPPGPREGQGEKAVRGGRPAAPQGRLNRISQTGRDAKRASPEAGSNCNGGYTHL